MKRRWKVFWIVSLIVFCLGIALCIAGAALGATWEMVQESVPGWINLGTRNIVTIDVGSTQEQAVPRDALEQEFTGIHSIEVDAEIIDLQILTGDDNETVKVNTEGEELSKFYNCHTDGRKLVIKTNNKFNLDDMWGTIWIYVPQNMLQEVEINVKAGTVYIEELIANNLSIDVEAGEAVVNKFHAKEVDFECGAGRIEAHGNAEKELEAKCGAGEIILGITGRKEDYNFEVECGVGEVVIDEESHSGIGSTERYSDGASKEMNIECGIGSIDVEFDNN